MKKTATSLLLGSINIILVGFGYLDNAKHILPTHLPRATSLLPDVTVFVVIPLLGLATVGFAIRDILRPSVRWQAIVAWILVIPIAIIYSRPW